MKRNTWGVVGMVLASAAVASLLTGCGGEAPAEDPDAIGLEQPSQCGGSVPRNLANLAAASADELGHWEATRDLRLTDDGTVVLSPDAEALCASGSGCARIRAVLALQDPATATSEHDPAAFNAALVAGLEKQQAAEESLDGMPDHVLARIGEEPSECGGRLYWFEAERAGCAGDCRYENPEALASKLLFAGYPDNRYLAFESATDLDGRPASLVAVDPGGDTPPDEPAVVPYCRDACQVTSTEPDLTGLCCTCNGIAGFFRPWSFRSLEGFKCYP